MKQQDKPMDMKAFKKALAQAKTWKELRRILQEFSYVTGEEAAKAIEAKGGELYALGAKAFE